MAPIKFGILMVPYQTLDVVGPIDILSSCSKLFFTARKAWGDERVTSLVDKAIDIEFFHINETMDAVTLTAGVSVNPTTTCDKCPPLDILIIGGPEPGTVLLPSFAKFIRAHLSAGKLLFTTCTGSAMVAQIGVLDGRPCTINHDVIDQVSKQFPAPKWTKDKQWIADGQIWTSAGACAGMDMVAHWVMQNYDPEVARLGFAMLDYYPRDVNGRNVPENERAQRFLAQA